MLCRTNKRPTASTLGAKAARRYRERQGETIKIGGTKIEDRVGIFPLPLRRAMEILLSADKRFKPPPAGATDREWREAIAEVAARILKDWAEKQTVKVDGA